MPETLRGLQQTFGAALRDPSASAVAAAALSGDVDRNVERIAIYRANAIGNATSALHAAYPVCAAIVGREFFDGLARAHWFAHPSTSGDLALYGSTLARFIAGFTPAREVPYLADVATLEWAVHLATAAPDAPVAPILREPALLWWPGSRVLCFDYPAADIWLAHQPDPSCSFDDIKWRAQGAFVHRKDLAVVVAPLDRDEAAALVELIESATSAECP